MGFTEQYNNPRNTKPQMIIVCVFIVFVILGLVTWVFDIRGTWQTILAYLFAYYAVGLVCSGILVFVKPDWDATEQCKTGYLIGIVVYLFIIGMNFGWW